MKLFKGALTEFQCPHCKRWVRLQKVRLCHKFALPAVLTNGKGVQLFRRIYECPFCGGIVLRCPK